MMEQKVLYIPDIAKLLGMTENAVRCHLRRGNYRAVPRPFRLGSRRLAWRREDFDAWLKKIAKGANSRAA